MLFAFGIFNFFIMLFIRFNSLSNRSLVITIIICICLIYISFTFNSCLINGLNWTLKKNNLISSSNGLIMLTEMPPLRDSNGNNSNHSNHNNKNDLMNLSKNTSRGHLNVLPSPYGDILAKLSSTINAIDDNQRNLTKSKYRLLRQTGYTPTRHLPDTLIIGVKKSGTRALLEFIRLHPDVRAAGYEVHFFDRHYQRGLHWYRHRMPYTIEGQLTMEKTPSYFVTKEVPKRVHKMNPFTRLLIVVRDPVTRAISDYTQAASKKLNMKRFEDLAFVNGTYSLVDTKWGPVKLGVYARFLEMWLKYFPLNQLLFISGERLIIDPAFEMRRVQDFLNLKYIVTEKHFYFNATKGFPCLLKSESRSMPHCLGKTKGRNHPYIDAEAIERLREFYRPFNERFYQMTGINFAWP